MEVLDRPQAARASAFEEEFERFKGVVAARRFPSDFISLFDKLRKSDMFPEPVKPRCFAYLIEQAATKVPDHFVTKLLAAIDASGCARALYADQQAGAEAVLQGLVRRCLELAPLTEEAQMAAFQSLERTGISRERIATIDMALRAGASTDFVDKVCDLTFYGHYPSYARPSALPVPSDLS